VQSVTRSIVGAYIPQPLGAMGHGSSALGNGVVSLLGVLLWVEKKTGMSCL
jgi:hypothetical protein